MREHLMSESVLRCVQRGVCQSRRRRWQNCAQDSPRCKAERSETTGHLRITMPKTRPVLKLQTARTKAKATALKGETKINTDTAHQLLEVPVLATHRGEDRGDCGYISLLVIWLCYQLDSAKARSNVSRSIRVYIVPHTFRYSYESPPTRLFCLFF